ncbi:cation/H(+) antiporter 15-like [Glycine soja]|uniref:cation/H(+) antiporter 15-like n=1 Tax=Glycine soja TaxID=3848 RepID=UPI00103D7D3F|nr:cation/H(+) antiporter 15-like [Glycine soja]
MATSRGNGIVSSYWDSHGQWQVCVEDDRNVGSLGIFIGDRPFEFVLPASKNTQIHLQRPVSPLENSRKRHKLDRCTSPTRQCDNVVYSSKLKVVEAVPNYSSKSPMLDSTSPIVVEECLRYGGGIILGPTFLGRSKTYWQVLFPPRQTEYLVMASLTGAVYFVFLVALKMDVLMTIRAAKSTWRLGVIPFLASFVVILALLCLYYHPQQISSASLTIARVSVSCLMSLSNFPVVSDAMLELNLTATELGQIALSSSMINDIILWLFIVMHSFTSNVDVKKSIALLGNWCLLVFFNFFVLRPTMKLIAMRTPVGKPVKELYVVLILLGVLVMAGVGDLMGVTFLMGPLIFGLVVPSGPPLGTTLAEKSEVLTTEFLLPFFFVYIGINTDLSALEDWRLFLTLQGVFFAGDLAKLLACVLVSLAYNIRPKHGTLLGLMLNIKGITQLISLARFKKQKMLDEDTFSQLVFCVVLITAIVTPLVNILYKHRPRVHAESLFEGELRTIQSTPRNREFHIVCCVHNEANVRGITALLEECNPVQESPICVYAVHLIELVGKSAPILLPIKHRHGSRKFLSVNYPNTNHIMQAFENYSNNSSGPVKVLPYINVAPYKSMHDAIFNLAQDNMVPFIIIPFHENGNIDLVGHVAASIRKMNIRFQAHAPCTLGILVDRHSRLGASNNNNMYFNVGVFFIGGAHDREALALGIRMSERADTRVSLFRFVIVNKKPCGCKIILTREEREEEEEDTMLDEGLIDEFKSMKYGIGNVCWYEITVDDGVEVLEAVHSLEGNYDLVMVGRRHNDGSLNGKEMTTFMENADALGILGDMLSSVEFCMGMVPVLVTQCGGVKISSSSNNKLDRVGSVNVSQKRLSVHK